MKVTKEPTSPIATGHDDGTNGIDFSRVEDRIKDILSFQLKYLDILLIKYPDSEKIASGFYVFAKK